MRNVAAAALWVILTARTDTKINKSNIKVCDGGSTGALWRRKGATEGGAESSAPLTGLTKQLKDISDVFAITRNIL